MPPRTVFIRWVDGTCLKFCVQHNCPHHLEPHHPIVFSPAKPYINLTSHSTPLLSSQSFHFLMSHLPTPLCPHSTIPIHLLSVPPPPIISFPTPHHSIHLLPVPPPLAEPSSIWPPPHHPVFELCPIPSTSSFLFCHHYFNPNQLLLQLYPTSDYFPYMNSTYLVPHDSPSLGYCDPHLSPRVPHPLHFSHSVYVQCTCVHECSVCTGTCTSLYCTHVYV